MRKTVALGTAAALAFMLGGCVGGSPQGSPSPSQVDEPIEDVYGPPVTMPDDGDDGPIQTKYGVPTQGRDGSMLEQLADGNRDAGSGSLE